MQVAQWELLVFFFLLLPLISLSKGVCNRATTGMLLQQHRFSVGHSTDYPRHTLDALLQACYYSYGVDQTGWWCWILALFSLTISSIVRQDTQPTRPHHVPCCCYEGFVRCQYCGFLRDGVREVCGITIN